jgi:hypothetical protein
VGGFVVLRVPELGSLRALLPGRLAGRHDREGRPSQA